MKRHFAFLAFTAAIALQSCRGSVNMCTKSQESCEDDSKQSPSPSPTPVPTPSQTPSPVPPPAEVPQPTESDSFETSFQIADKNFAVRDLLRNQTRVARRNYLFIIDAKGAKGQNLIRAAIGALRTYIYEGDAYLSDDTPFNTQTKKTLFNEMQAVTAEKISPQNFGAQAPAYYYFKAAGIEREMRASTVLQRLALLPELQKSLDAGQALTGGESFEGGGILRVKAMAKSNPDNKGLPGTLYNPPEAVLLSDRAINQPASDGGVAGMLFCENFYVKAFALSQDQKLAAALQVISKARNDFFAYMNSGLIPEYRRAETNLCLIMLANLQNKLSQIGAGPDEAGGVEDGGGAHGEGEGTDPDAP